MTRRITKIKREPAGAPVTIINNKIEVRPIHRKSQEVPDWRNAMQHAESIIPRRQMLYNLYHDTVIDDQVIAAWGKRTDAVTAAEWRFVDKEGEEIDEINELVDSLGFDELITEILNTKAWGYSMLEPKFYRNHSQRWEMSANLAPRRHMHVEAGIISYDGISEDGINVRTGIYTKTVMEVGNTKDLGLLLPASLPAILKRGGTGDYAAFVQVFGSPIVDAAWDGHDDTQRQQLNQALQAMGSGGTLVRPKGTEVTMLENKTASNQPHSPFLERMDKAIAKCLLGTTETTDSSKSSGYAQSQTHQTDDNLKKAGDISYVRKVLNSRFIKILETHGFDTKGGKFTVAKEELETSPSEQYTIVSGLHKDLGLPIDHEWLYEKFGVKKPDDYDQQIKDKQLLQQEQQTIEPPKTPPNKPKTNKGKEAKVNGKKEQTEEKEVKLVESFMHLLKNKSFLKHFFLTAPAETTGAMTTMCCGNLHTIKLSNDQLDYDAVIRSFWEAKEKSVFDLTLFKHTIKNLLNAFKQGWNTDFIALGFDTGFVYGDDDPAMLTAFEQNLFRFSGTKTLAQVQALNQLFKEAKSFDDFYRRANRQLKVFNKTWLESEYNTALLTGQAAATYHRLIKQKKIFPYWRYETVGDEHVRTEHALLQGLILPADDPRWLKIFPPNGWNCRCRIVPMTLNEIDKSKINEMRDRADAYLGGTQFEKEEAQGFGVNRAVLKEVFTANQQYIRKFPNKASKQLNNLQASDFELPSYSNAKKVATKEIPVYDKTADDFWEEQIKESDKTRVLSDYGNRMLVISEKDYRQHVKKKDNRVVLLNAMEQALNSPDEVWTISATAQKAIEAEKKGLKYKAKIYEEISYIKYFKDKTIVVQTHAKNGVLEIKTWFTLNERKKEITAYRRGLLMYQK